VTRLCWFEGCCSWQHAACEPRCAATGRRQHTNGVGGYVWCPVVEALVCLPAPSQVVCCSCQLTLKVFGPCWWACWQLLDGARGRSCMFATARKVPRSVWLCQSERRIYRSGMMFEQFGRHGRTSSTK
jgi:hypothetical protein